MEKGDVFLKRNNRDERTYRLVLVALMITMTLILNRVLPSTPVYHLTVDFIPVFIVAVLFGPVWSAATYAIADTIGAILFPVGPYNPGITLTLLLIGLIFGLVFYKKDLTGISLWVRSFVASAGTLLVKLFATTYFLFLIYGGPNGMGYLAYVIARIPNCVTFALLVFVLIPVVEKVIIERLKRIYR